MTSPYSIRDLFAQLNAGVSPINVDKECGYPAVIPPQDYRRMYDREGIGARAVGIFPEHCWDGDPEIYEDEDSGVETDFEKDVKALIKDETISLFSYLERLDIESGIGRFGCMLLGLDDGKELKEPVDGITDKPESQASATEMNLMYLRVFDESKIQIKAVETDKTSPRFGWPTLYTFEYANMGVGKQSEGTETSIDVHWTRVHHVCDRIGEPFHAPRMEVVWNRLLDLRKNYGGSAQSTWQGGFSGIALEPVINGDIQYEIDPEQVKQGMQDYISGLQRYIALEGLKANSLQTQVYDPTAPIEVQLKAIALVLGIPYRVFMGTEEAQLAGSQDMKAWNKRISKRQERLVTPVHIRRLIDYLIRLHVISPVKDEEEGYCVEWPDRAAQTRDERSKTAVSETQALASYVSSGVGTIMPLREYLSIVLGWEKEVVDLVVKEAEKAQLEDGSLDDPTNPDPNADPMMDPDPAMMDEEPPVDPAQPTGGRKKLEPKPVGKNSKPPASPAPPVKK